MFANRLLVLALSLFSLVPAAWAVSDPPAIEVTGQSLRGYATTLLVEDDMAYVTMGSALVVLDVTNPEQPCELGRAYAQTCFSGNPTLAKLPGGTYFLTPSDLYGIEVFDVSGCQTTYPSCSADPACQPLRMTTLFDPATPGDRTDPGGGLFYQPAAPPSQGGFLYCANGGRGVKVYEAALSPGGNTLAGFDLVDVFLPPAGELPPWPILQDYSLNLVVEGQHAYVAARSSGLHVWDLSDPRAPSFQGYYWAFLLDPWTLDVLADGDVVFLGHSTALGGTCGIQTVDVSNPAAPAQRGCYPGQALDFFRDLSVQPEGNPRLLAAANGPKGFSLFEIDAGDTADTIRLLSTWSDNHYAEAVQLEYPYLHMTNTHGGFVVTRISGEGALEEVGRVEADNARDLVIVDYGPDLAVAYLADGPRGLVAVDVTEPGHPTRETVVEIADPGVVFGSASGIEHRDGILYVADEQQGLFAFRLLDPYRVERLLPAPIATAGTPLELLAYGDDLFVADGSGGIARVRIEDPAHPELVGSWLPAGMQTVTRLEANGGRLYALGTAAGSEGKNLSVFHPGDLSVLGQTRLRAAATNDVAFASSGSVLYAYVGLFVPEESQQGAFAALNVTDPGAMPDPEYVEVEASIGFDFYVGVRSVESVEVVGDRLFVVHENAGVYAFDISDPLRPVQLAEFLLSANNNTYEFLHRDGTLYNAHGDAGLYAFQYTHPTGPYVVQVDPVSGYEGDPITIQGTLFGQPGEDRFVTFHGLRASQYLEWTPSRIVVVLPAGAADGPAVVWVDGTASNGVDFDVISQGGGWSLRGGPAGSLALFVPLLVVPVLRSRMRIHRR